MSLREHCLMVVGVAVTCVLWVGLMWWLGGVCGVENGAAQDRMDKPGASVNWPGDGRLSIEGEST